ncbi:MAG: HK97 family phage prohead protease [Bacteroidales bacterium]|nr:HK97 family phage prohead protease [Bacteroidales bacterium]
MEELFIRVSQAGTKSGERKMTFVASDATRDSYGTVLMPDGWMLDRFSKNPVIGYQHKVQWSGSPDDIIGKGRAYIEDNRLMVEVEFEPAELNPMAEKVWKKLEFGTLNAVSVGFIPKEGRWGVGEEAPGKANETYYYTRMELLEVSVVAIPANPNALKNDMEPENDRLAALRKEALANIEKTVEKALEPVKEEVANQVALKNRKAIAIAETEALLLQN